MLVLDSAVDLALVENALLCCFVTLFVICCNSLSLSLSKSEYERAVGFLLVSRVLHSTDMLTRSRPR